jgi:hypothetical protein
MNLNRRKFGRHTVEMLQSVNNEREHESNTILSLMKHYIEFNKEISKYLTSQAFKLALTTRHQQDIDLSKLDNHINDYFLKSIQILNIQDVPELDFSEKSEDIDAKDIKIIHKIILTIYLTLLHNYNAGDINSCVENEKYFCLIDNDVQSIRDLNQDLKVLIQFTIKSLCHGNDLTIKLRIIIFLHLLNNIYTFQFMDCGFSQQCQQRRSRILDLLKSEFMLFNLQSSSSPTSNNGKLNSNGDSIDLQFNLFISQLCDYEVLQNHYCHHFKLFLR